MDQVTGALCQHIIGMNPREIGTPETPKIEGKAVKKKRKGDKQEETESKENLVEEDEGQLLRQEFILDPDLTVQKYLEANAPKVVEFVRFECGEVLPGDEDDWWMEFNLLLWSLVYGQTGLGKQCRPRSDCFRRTSLIRVRTVCHSAYMFMFWTHISLMKPG